MNRLTWTTKTMLSGETQYVGYLGQLECAYLTPRSAVSFYVEITLGGKDRSVHASFPGLTLAKDEAERRVTTVLMLTGLLDQITALEDEVKDLSQKA
jgi:hypothetical protein